MAGTLTISTLSDGTNSTSATNCIRGSARAWLYYNGVTQTILNSYNVSSVTYVTSGQYTINFTTAMPNANYCVHSNNGEDADLQTAIQSTTTSSCLLYVGKRVGTGTSNMARVYLSVFSS